MLQERGRSEMILETIVEQKRREVEALKRDGIGEPGQEIAPPRGFIRHLLAAPGLAIIAEAKKASPSKGVICPDFDPETIVRHYQDNGAHCLSVLTDEPFFQGSLEYLVRIRATVDLPVLRKDFLIDPVQIEQSAVYGADCILLIVAILDPLQVHDFRQQAEEQGMDVLVEVHDERELETALAAGSRLIGINNRNLKTFTVDLATTFRLLRLVPPEIPVVSESGIKDADQIRELLAAGVRAALIGESLMRSGVESTLLQEFVQVRAE